jgi:hypothetical protein
VLSPLYPQDKPTDAQLRAWWGTLTPEQQTQEIRKLDDIERAVPEILMPYYGAVLLKNGDLVIFPEEEIMYINIDYLRYAVTLKEYKLDGFYLPDTKDFMDYFTSISLGVCIGLIGTLVVQNAEPWQYAVSGLCGGIMGFVIVILI